MTALRLTIGAMALLLPGCVNRDYQVAGHQYNVPDAYLIPVRDYPFFLPEPEDDGFIFIINPNAELPQQITVLVEALDDVCARANGRGYVSKTICSSERVDWQGKGWRKSGSDKFWTYSPDTRVAVDAPYVSCFKTEAEGNPGLCSASLTLGETVLTIGFKDDALPALETTYQRAAAMLRSWEV